jgi:two-component system, sensor histidine kinase and response regulator
MNVGITAYCLKPIKQSELFEIISTALNKSSEGAKRPALVTRHSVREVKRSLSVLLAEDNAINQKLATRILEKMGHNVTIAENGREALEILEKMRFDIILMDVQMPKMDGFEATSSIREKEKITGGHIPIVAMTAHAMSGDREKCLAAGMDGYVSKPINTKELVENIEGLVDKREAASQARSAAIKAGEIVDGAQLLARVGDDVDFLGELVNLFLDTGGEMLSQVEFAVRQGNADTIERTAHTIKGALGNFAADRAFEAALKLETIGRDGALKHADRAFKDLEKEISLFKDVLVSLKQNNFQDILPC